MAVNLSTVNQKEVDYFNSADEEMWWKPNILLAMNKVRNPALIKFLIKSGQITEEQSKSEKPLKGIKILDVGCGAGLMTEPLAEMGADIVGLDVAQEPIKCAKNHAAKNINLQKPDVKLEYVLDTIENYCQQNAEEFDVVITIETLEHVDNIDIFLESCAKCVKPNGSIFVSTINRTFYAWARIIIYFEYIKGVISKGAHEYKKFVTPAEVETILKNGKCNKKDLGGWCYNVGNKEFLPCDDISGFYYLFAVKE